MPVNTADQVRETPRQQRKAWVWIMLMVNIVFLLILMTLGIIALRVGNYLPDTDLVFIVGADYDVEVTDGENKSWDTEQALDIFVTSHSNDDGDVTVDSQDDMNIIAPGTEMDYQFTMYNHSNVAMMYDVDIDFFVRVTGINAGTLTEENIPLKINLKSVQDDYYIIGGANEFIDIADALVSKHRRVLGANSYETFELALVWDFSGDDITDTELGDLSAEDDIIVTLGINTFAQQHVDPAASGGVSLDMDQKTEIGGTIRWVWILLLLVNTAIIIFYVSWLMNKRLQKW